MEHVSDGLNSPMAEFRKINAWASTAGTSGAFRRSALGVGNNPTGGTSAKQTAQNLMGTTSSLSYTSMS